MSYLEKLLDLANEKQASDIHINENGEIYIRCADIIAINESTNDLFTNCNNKKIFKEIIKNKGDKSLELTKTCDFALKIKEQRLRAHLYKAQELWNISLRILPKKTPCLENDPDKGILQKLCKKNKGLVIVAGGTGSGKSHTLAACLEEINKLYKKHIITIEDPIEIEFSKRHSLIHQRELNKDIKSMAVGVKEALREDPDVIMIGEMRDLETIKAGILAAETGHLVFATMHTNSAAQSIGRIISAYPNDKSEEIRLILAQILLGVICQNLYRVRNKPYPIREIMLNTKAIANLIRQKKEHQIYSIQELDENMTTFKQAKKRAQLIFSANEIKESGMIR